MENHNDLTIWTKLGLFVTSYSPLFIILIIRQIGKIPSKVDVFQINADWMKYYFAVFFLAFVVAAGISAAYISKKIIESDLSKNGVSITVTHKENKNSEALGYLCTYVLSFNIQSLSEWGEILALLVLLAVAFEIYTRSNLFYINPILTFTRNVYSVEFQEKGCPGHTYKGIIIAPKSNNYRNLDFIVKNIGENVYFAKERA